MPIILNQGRDSRVMEVQISGRIVHEDYHHFVPEFEKWVSTHGKVRLLFDMVEFRGWEAAAAWDDLKFDAKHFSDIERLAIVGDNKWEKLMAILSKPFIKAELRYFDHTEIAAARLWLEDD